MIQCPPPLRAIWKEIPNQDTSWLLELGWKEEELSADLFFDTGNNYELMKLVSDWEWYQGNVRQLDRECASWRLYAEKKNWPKNHKFRKGLADSVLAFEERWS